ncbi:MAG: TadE/TadG family type IV pilus assembly protein [Lautropia sp.]
MRAAHAERRSGARARQSGASALELAIGLPVLLLLGLSIVQIGLVYQARASVEYAIFQAARRASVAHADMQAARHGFAQGLAPWLFGASDAAGLQAAEARALAHVEAGLARGWIELERRSPAPGSFDDWGEPARDAFGDPIDGVVEIPNDNLDSRRLRMQPTGGASADREGEPIGPRAGQTLVDANRLRLHVAYGVRLFVPLVGSAIVAILRTVHRCDGGAATAGAGAGAGGRAEHSQCNYLMADPPRLALRAAASVRMMSTARRGTAGTAPVAVGAADPGAGSAGTAVPDASAPADDAAVSGVGATPTDTQTPAGAVEGVGSGAGNGADSGEATARAPTGGLADGFLMIGGNRAYPMPHPALCSG